MPAYKPTFNMIDLKKELNKPKFEIVIVNDGSGNEYDEIFKEASILVLGKRIRRERTCMRIYLKE